MCRVNLDFTGNSTKYYKKLHPKDTLFRGEFDVVDYELIENLYIVVLLPGSVFVVD